MELLSPAGNVEKLYYAYAYGADAAYIGLKKFSLRVKADNFYDDEYKKVIELKKQFPGKKLHCALNISFHNSDIDNFISNIDYFKAYPIDAFIVQDIGIVPILQKHFPEAALHVSTQASCINREAVKMYKSLGFSRVVLGREVSLKEIREIKDAVPDMELEAFCHGAMCIAYAGRCLMSAYLTGRSAQAGACTHTCRWDYDVLADPKKAKELAESGALVLREKKRPDSYFPVYEGDDFTAVLSSKDIRMVEHLKDMKDAGLDSLKIEGRMKSVYYVALVTRAYRKALDALDGKISAQEAQLFIDELENVSHRESGTGFYYNRSEADETVSGATDSRYILAAEVVKKISMEEEAEVLKAAALHKENRRQELEKMHPNARAARAKDYALHPEKNPPVVEKKENWSFYKITPLNMIHPGDKIEFISPDTVCTKPSPDSWLLVNPENGTLRSWVCDGHECLLYTDDRLEEGALIRVPDPDYVEGFIRDSGR
ncbi:MAG: U32 family peptidase [Treponema porcinum]|uniref:peptidase U32 family protein n=1 Tax=Treponema porcinum TaxID=261392 RepID=UPI002353207A|nr:U32 family peptidase [Treponema porcinum]MCI6179855.1 U32 family peptidase [Treponema porcinum]MCI6815026.1 U32 family peptidase [Treponema porcinum]MDY5049338.1 U32 family peptidase [Treponema porcinum]